MNINMTAIPAAWRTKADPHIELLVRAFQETGLDNPKVLAYACASIARESSWNPRAENRSDRAAWTPYSGKGLAQVTLESNYRKISQFTGINFLGNPDLMFVPYYSLRAKAAHFTIHGMVPYIMRGEFEAAAGIYNAGNANYRSAYTRDVAIRTSEWLPVFSAPPVVNHGIGYPYGHDYNYTPPPPRHDAPPRLNEPPRYTPPAYPSPPSLAPVPPPSYIGPPRYNEPPRYNYAPPAATQPRIYIVQRGDRLASIAAHFGISLRTLLASNPQIRNPNLIKIGQMINIPV